MDVVYVHLHRLFSSIGYFRIQFLGFLFCCLRSSSSSDSQVFHGHIVRLNDQRDGSMQCVIIYIVCVSSLGYFRIRFLGFLFCFPRSSFSSVSQVFHGHIVRLIYEYQRDGSMQCIFTYIVCVFSLGCCRTQFLAFLFCCSRFSLSPVTLILYSTVTL